MLNVTLICSDINHPVFSYLQAWCHKSHSLYNIQLVSTTADIKNENGLLFLISCSEFIKKNSRNKFEHAVVLHASDLPFGRGWSPHIWDIIHGKCEVVLSLLNAEAEIDTGDVWKKIRISLDGSE